MKDCKAMNRKFEKALYGELTLTEKEAFYNHLENCDTCSTEFNNLKETLSLLKERKRVEPNEEFMNNFWNELNPKLQKQSRFVDLWKVIKNLFRFELKIPYQVAAGLTILILGVFIGKYFLGSSDHVNNTIITGNEKQSQKIVQARAEKYLDRSKVLLLGLMNFDPNSDDFETISLSHQQKISKELITEATNLKDDLDRTSTLQLRQLIDDIEMILMQIANLEEQQDIDGIELIKDGVDQRGIFLKINIREMKKSSQETDVDSNSNNKKENNT